MFKIFLKVNRGPEALTFEVKHSIVLGLSSKSAVRDNGMCSSPFSDDLKLNAWISV